jgi:transitional endoplasmic reticulum ATPase
MKVVVIIQRAEILLSHSVDYRILDSVKSWISFTNDHTLLLMTDDKTSIHNEIKQINPVILKHIEWMPPTKEDFERVFINLRILKPNMFDVDSPQELASACQGIYYFELEKILNTIEKEKCVLTEMDLRKSSEKLKKDAIKNTSSDWFVSEKPGITFDNIAGLEKVKELIQVKIVYPFKHPELLKNRVIRQGGGLLLYGPPGTGKTMIGKAIATELEAPFFEAKVADIKNMYVGQSENNVKKLFAEARKHPPLGIVFIDEIESLIPKRGSIDCTHMNGVVAQFLAEMDGLSTHRKTSVLVIGATNRPQDIDNAALRPGRFDHKILVPLPDKEARKQMFYLILNKRYIDKVNYESLAVETEGYSGADIADICGNVEYDLSLLDIRNKQSHRITTELIMKTIHKISPSVTRTEMEWFRQYEHVQGGTGR